MSFIFPVRVYYEDTDSGGVVYHASYLKFMERARSEWLRQLGYTYEQAAKDGIIFAVRSAQIEYLRPARHDHLLYVVTHIKIITKASITFEQIIHSAEDTSLVFCTGDIKIACIDAVAMRPCAIPEFLSREIQRGT